MHLGQHLVGLVVLLQTYGSLGTGHIVVGFKDITPEVADFLFGEETVEKRLPLDGQLLQRLVVTHLLELVAIVGIQVGNGGRQRGQARQQVEALAVGRDALFAVVHIGIDIAHQIIGNTHAVLVVAALGVVEHRLYLAQRHIILAAEHIGVDQIHPVLVALVPLLV